MSSEPPAAPRFKRILPAGPIPELPTSTAKRRKAKASPAGPVNVPVRFTFTPQVILSEDKNEPHRDKDPDHMDEQELVEAIVYHFRSETAPEKQNYHMRTWKRIYALLDELNVEARKQELEKDDMTWSKVIDRLKIPQEGKDHLKKDIQRVDDRSHSRKDVVHIFFERPSAFLGQLDGKFNLSLSRDYWTACMDVNSEKNHDDGDDFKHWDWGTELNKPRDDTDNEAFKAELKKKIPEYAAWELLNKSNPDATSSSSSFILPPDENEPFHDEQVDDTWNTEKLIHALVYLIRTESPLEKRERTLQNWMRGFALRSAYKKKFGQKMDVTTWKNLVQNLPPPLSNLAPKFDSDLDENTKGSKKLPYLRHISSHISNYTKSFLDACRACQEDKSKVPTDPDWDWGFARVPSPPTNSDDGDRTSLDLKPWQVEFQRDFIQKMSSRQPSPKKTKNGADK